MVVLTSRCPSSSWTVRMSCPSSSRWVANEWRKVWHVACLAMPARRIASLTARWGTVSGRGGPGPRPGALGHAESRPVQEQCHQARDPVELAEDGSNLFAGQDDGQPPGAFRVHDAVEPGDLLAEHLAVQEQQRAQRLVLRGGRHLPLNSERPRELRHLSRSHLGGMALAVKQDVPADPPDVRLFRATAVVARAYGVAHPVEESRPLWASWTET